jgi:hypothetical protein
MGGVDLALLFTCDLACLFLGMDKEVIASDQSAGTLSCR